MHARLIYTLWMELRLVIPAYQTNNNIGNVNPTLAIFANLKPTLDMGPISILTCQINTHIGVGTQPCNTYMPT